ncbi:hypothetical protein Lal_00033803 [Lupinus albus]|nr:hypothetical protein Lal_00033803 [Lupinus albus]
MTTQDTHDFTSCTQKRMRYILLAIYVMNKTLLRSILHKTPYKLYKGRKLNISHFHVLDANGALGDPYTKN